MEGVVTSLEGIVTESMYMTKGHNQAGCRQVAMKLNVLRGVGITFGAIIPLMYIVYMKQAVSSTSNTKRLHEKETAKTVLMTRLERIEKNLNKLCKCSQSPSWHTFFAFQYSLLKYMTKCTVIFGGDCDSWNALLQYLCYVAWVICFWIWAKIIQSLSVNH